jgi:rhodanese-related sulfurtransferase
MKVICPKECKERITQGESIKIVDVREFYEYDQCNIGSKHIPMAEIIERQKELDENDQLVIMCRTGKRAAAVANLLEHESSCKNVWVMEGGITGWKEKVDSSLNID